MGVSHSPIALHLPRIASQAVCFNDRLSGTNRRWSLHKDLDPEEGRKTEQRNVLPPGSCQTEPRRRVLIVAGGRGFRPYPVCCPLPVSITIEAAVVRILMEALQIFVELLVLGPGMRMFVEFFMSCR